MNKPHSHPAHRLPPDLPIRDDSADFVAAVRLLAETPMTSEMPGVHRDDLADKLIGVARDWAAREDRSAAFSKAIA